MIIIIINLDFCLSALFSGWVPHVEHKTVIKLLIGNIKSCIDGVLSCGEITILLQHWANARISCLCWEPAVRKGYFLPP